MSFLLPESPGFLYHPSIDNATRDQETLIRYLEPPQAYADREAEYGISKRYPTIHARIGPDKHAVAGLSILFAYGPA